MPVRSPPAAVRMHRKESNTVVEDHVERLAVLEGKERLLNAPDVLLVGLALPGKHRDARGS
jgi:hypothetical protein